MKNTGLLIVLLFTSICFGQNQITGFAPDFVGQAVKLYAYQDYLTLNRVLLAEGKVSPVDSTFQLTVNTNTTLKAIIEIDRTEASLYLAPNRNYNVYFPESVAPVSYNNAITNLYFSDLDTLDINYLILQYQQWFDTFIAYNERGIARHGFLAYLDTFQIYASEAYKTIDDPYFITYVRYDIGEMVQTFGGNGSSEQRLEIFLNYIEPFPVYFENDRYMKFLMAFYDKEFREYLPKTEAEIMGAIAQSSPTLLMKALKSDIFLARPELRELVMVDKLGKAFYNETEFRPNIITILDSVANHSKVQTNASAAKNVKRYITSLEAGYPAPAIAFQPSPGKSISWGNYKGKFVYFNFFATWNDRAVNDMEIISKLVPEYDEDIAFLSVCTDQDSSSFKAFLKEHPDYTWDIVYIGDKSPLMDSYKVTSVPMYYLIDQDGFIYSAPALAPSPNGKYQSIEKDLFMIKKALHPQDAIRVGEK